MRGESEATISRISRTTLCSPGCTTEAAVISAREPISMLPKTFMMMQEWCAVTARPDSETMCGSGTPSFAQMRCTL